MAGYHISHLVSERVEMGTVVPEYAELGGGRVGTCLCLTRARVSASSPPSPILGRVEECVGG